MTRPPASGIHLGDPRELLRASRKVVEVYFTVPEGQRWLEEHGAAVGIKVWDAPLVIHSRKVWPEPAPPNWRSLFGGRDEDRWYAAVDRRGRKRLARLVKKLLRRGVELPSGDVFVELTVLHGDRLIGP